MAGPTILCEARGSLVVYVGGDVNPSDAEWDAYLSLVARVAREHGRVRIAAFAQNGTPSAKQRKKAGATATTLSLRSAVITDRALARAVVTGLHWLGVDVRAFRVWQANEAFDYIEASPNEREWLMASAQELALRLEKLDPEQEH